MERATSCGVEVVAHIAVLREYKDGSTLELNRTQQGSNPEKWDLRRWHKDEAGRKSPGRGILLNDRELDELKAVLNEYC